jgi:hypothetical protein
LPAYLAFGLRIQSERELPDGVQADLRRVSSFSPDSSSSEESETDLTVRWAEPDARVLAMAEAGGDDGWFEFHGDVHRFGWPTVGTFEIFRGREVLVRPQPNAPKGLVEHVILGMVIADVLLTRGFIPLHSSANCVGEGTVAFVGVSGQGKSTMAAAMHQAGYAAHADDLLALPVDSEPLVPFGISRIKLNPDSAQTVGEDPQALSMVYEGIEKRSKIVVLDRERPARPLTAIYRLVDAPEVSIVRVDPRKALFELFSNCFFVEIEMRACGPQELMRRCASVATRVPLFELRRPRDFQRLPEVVEAVATHARSLAQPAT